MSEHSRALLPGEMAIAGYQWLTTQAIVEEMGTSRATVINIIRSGAFGAGNVTRWGREYRVRPEAFRAYLERRAAAIDAGVDSAA